MAKSFHAGMPPVSATPSMFLVLRWNPNTPLPPARPRAPRPVLPPAPHRLDSVLAAIDALRAKGMTTLADIARGLNDDHVPTLSGRGAWHGAQVARAEAKRAA